MWYVVLFPGENSLSTVPSTWYVETSDECFWPPSSFKQNDFNRYCKEQYLPDDDWKPHPAKIVGRYDKYSEAMAKLVKAKESLSSSNENEHEPRKRKRKPSSKYLDSDSGDDLNYDDDDDGHVSYPKFKLTDLSNENQGVRTPVFKPSPKPASKPSYSENMIDSKTRRKSTTELDSNKSKNKNLFYRTRSGSLSPNLLNNRSHENIDLESSQTTTASSSRGRFSEVISADHSIQPQNQSDVNIAAVLEYLKKMHAENLVFQQQTERKLSLINLKVTDLEKSMKLLRANGLEQHMEENPEVTELLQLLPLTMERLQTLENNLANVSANIKKQLAVQLSLVGGRDVHEVIKRLMYKLFTNEAGTRYSWDGAKGKLKFRELAICTIIISAVRLNPNTQAATEADITTNVKKWLVRSKERLNSGSSR